jgi:hypothetical protein
MIHGISNISILLLLILYFAKCLENFTKTANSFPHHPQLNLNMWLG